MIVGKELYRIEEGLWSKGKEHFLEKVGERSLLAFHQHSAIQIRLLHFLDREA